MTQHEKILDILSDSAWHCTNEMYSAYIADPRTRIAELKKKGYILMWQWCQQHPHKKSKEWQLLAEPFQIAQKAPSSEITPKQQEGTEFRQIRGVEPSTLPAQSPLINVPNTISH